MRSMLALKHALLVTCSRSLPPKGRKHCYTIVQARLAFRNTGEGAPWHGHSSLVPCTTWAHRALYERSLGWSRSSAETKGAFCKDPSTWLAVV